MVSVVGDSETEEKRLVSGLTTFSRAYSKTTTHSATHPNNLAVRIDKFRC
jgi:hypothetical protein